MVKKAKFCSSTWLHGDQPKDLAPKLFEKENGGNALFGKH
jgi:hypothetical protein